ncbi:MAG: hypothetical protein QXP06_05000 [Candidatus Bathyarchaeia archaeon]
MSDVENKDIKRDENAEFWASGKNVQEETAETVYFLHSSGVSGGDETSSPEEFENNRAGFEQKLQELLKNINEETLQLSEFLTEENKLIKELCDSLKQVLKKLRVSFYIPPREIPVKGKVKKVILNEECCLILVYDKGETRSAFLAEYPPEIVLAILLVIMPELAEVLMLHRKRISARINFFVKIKKELKNVVKAIVGNQVTEEADRESVDVVKSTLNAEN